MTFVLPLVSLVHRELLRFYRQRGRIIGSLGSPIIFWLFLGSGLQAAFPGMTPNNQTNFLEYFFPGNLMLTVLFTSIFSNISIIEDRHEGFLQSVLVAPVSRWTVVGGKVFGGTAIAFLQGLIFLMLAPLAKISLSLESVGLCALAILVSGLALSALGFIFAWWMDSVQGFHSIMNLLLFPMWLLSGAFFPVSAAPIWLKPVMLINPVTYGVSAIQMALKAPTAGLQSYGTQIVVTAVFGFLFLVISVVVVQKGSRKGL